LNAEPEDWRLRDTVRPALLALAQHWKAFVLIQCCLIGYVIGFYRYESFAAAGQVLADWKIRYGWWFVGILAGVASGVLPEIAKALTAGRGSYKRPRLREILFRFVYFGSMGVLVDRFYHLQGVMFGQGKDPATLLLKLVVDQVLFSAAFSIPLAVTVFAWQDLGFNFKALRAELGWEFIRDRILPVLVPGWCFWIPAVLCVYAMPGDMQTMLYLFLAAAWAVLFLFIVQDERGTKPYGGQ